jgi:hypothetical protein
MGYKVGAILRTGGDRMNASAGGASVVVTVRPSLFPTFFLSGFECSTFLWKEAGRRDLSAELQHYEHADDDYAMLGPIGIAVAREGIPWPLVHRGGGATSPSGRITGRSCSRP